MSLEASRNFRRFMDMIARVPNKTRVLMLYNRRDHAMAVMRHVTDNLIEMGVAATTRIHDMTITLDNPGIVVDFRGVDQAERLQGYEFHAIEDAAVNTSQLSDRARMDHRFILSRMRGR